jgi:integrase
VEIGQVRPITVGEWIASMSKRKLSASRIRQAYVVLSQIMKAAVHNEMIRTSPCRGIKLPRLPQTEPHVLTQDEVKRLIAAADAPLDLIVQILAFGGLRIGEVFALRRGRVALETGHLVVAESLTEIAGRHSFGTPKSHQMRVITIPAFLVEALRAHLDRMTDKDPSALLFVGRTGKPLHYNAWRTWKWDPAVKAAGLEDVTPHDLRATHASYVAERHGVMAAARRLGHANASVTTRHYARALDGKDAEIAESLDADRDGTSDALTGEEGEDVAREWHGSDDDDPPGVAAKV